MKGPHAGIPDACSAHPLLSMPATELAAAIARGEASARDAVEASISRIESVNPRLNAVVVPLFEQAQDAARDADEWQARGEPLGPLHGVPISVKEMFDLAGTPTTAGLPGRAKHRAERDAVVVARLRAAGAIVVGKTNVPQLGLLGESDNPLYGPTNHPFDANRSPGGSSGGEAAIVAAGAVPLGVGSDGGGSIRQPSHCCGISGIKPSGRRLPMQGHFMSLVWSPEWLQPGPMARRAGDLWPALKIMHGRSGSGDMESPPVPLSDPAHLDLARLRIGFFTQTGDLPAAPAVRRAVEEAAQSLCERGAAVEPFEPPAVMDAWRLYMAIFYADGLADMKRQTRGGAIDWRIREYFRMTIVPSLLRRPVARLYEALGRRRTAQVLRWVRRPALPAAELLALLGEERAYRRQFAAAMDEQRLDALLCPVSAVPAPRHGEFFAAFSLLYTGLFNMLALPAGCVPITRVREGEESERPVSRDPVDQSLARCEQGSAGLPVGVQVVGRWWREDVVLAVMTALEESRA